MQWYSGLDPKTDKGIIRKSSKIYSLVNSNVAVINFLVLTNML